MEIWQQTELKSELLSTMNTHKNADSQDVWNNRGFLFARKVAPLMFVNSLVFLVALTVMIVLFVDMPRLEEMATQNLEGSLLNQSVSIIAYLMGFLLTFSIAELLVKIVLGRLGGTLPNWSESIAAFCPPLRLATPIAQMNGRTWLPGLGWRLPGKRLSRYLERKTSVPMLCIAMLILPVLLVEFKFQSEIDARPWLQTVLHVCTGLIWFAFTVEFIVMVNATDKRMRYVKKNWIDLAIILLPLISFLRSLRIVRAARLARFAKLQQLTKMTRVYRMRGLVAKTLRALLLFEIVHRIFRISPERRLVKLEDELAEKEEELVELRERIRLVRAEVLRNAEKETKQHDVVESSRTVRSPKFLGSSGPKKCA